jgi:hypothetical protein
MNIIKFVKIEEKIALGKKLLQIQAHYTLSIQPNTQKVSSMSSNGI